MLQVLWGGMAVFRLVPPQPQGLPVMQTVKRDLGDIRHILKVFAPLPLFWSLFYQQNSTWVFQAQQMNREIGKSSVSMPLSMSLRVSSCIFCLVPTFFLGPFGKIPRLVIPPDIMPSLEDIFCILLILAFDKVLYPLLTRFGRPLRPLRRIGVGFFFITLSFVMAGFLQLAIDHYGEGQLSVAWQVPQIFCMACAEILVRETISLCLWL